MHVHKSQGLTADTAGVLMGGWQTDREHAYVALSRARESTHIYVSRQDLGEQGMDVGAIERLAERMHQSRAQEATISKEAPSREQAIEPDVRSRFSPGNSIVEEHEPRRALDRAVEPGRDDSRGVGME